MPLAGSSTPTFQQCIVGSEPNMAPLCAPHPEGVQVSVKNTFIEVGPKSPPALQRSVTEANVSTSSSSNGISPVSAKLRLPLSLSSALDTVEIPATPSMGMVAQSPMDAYFDPCGAQSPMTRWYEGTPSCAGARSAVAPCLQGYTSSEGQISSCCAEGASPLARWLRGSPSAHEQAMQGRFAMGLERSMEPQSSVPEQACFAPFGHPMMWPTVPMMATNSTHTAAPSLPTAVPTVMLVPQQALSVRPLQMIPEASSGDVNVTAAGTTANHGVWQGMAAWKEGQSNMDREWKGEDARAQFKTLNKNPARVRGKNAISKKPADKDTSLGPRAVFVDLSKIVPTGIAN